MEKKVPYFVFIAPCQQKKKEWLIDLNIHTISSGSLKALVAW